MCNIKKYLSALAALTLAVSMTACGAPPAPTVTEAPAPTVTEVPAPVVTEALTSSIPDNAAEFNGHYYSIYHVDVALSWEEAQEFCESVGGYLATLTSKEESDFAYSLMRDAGCKAASFGLSDLKKSNKWEWVTGEAFSYENWAPGQPDNEYQHCGAFNEKVSGDQWDNAAFHCDAFICEWGDFNAAEEQSNSSRIPVPIG